MEEQASMVGPLPTSLHRSGAGVEGMVAVALEVEYRGVRHLTTRADHWLVQVRASIDTRVFRQEGQVVARGRWSSWPGS